jgi:hypothetical protein
MEPVRQLILFVINENVLVVERQYQKGLEPNGEKGFGQR